MSRDDAKAHWFNWARKSRQRVEENPFGDCRRSGKVVTRRKRRNWALKSSTKAEMLRLLGS
ncbi:hypothetical protein ACNKHW_15260 [Shigella flexneri]